MIDRNLSATHDPAQAAPRRDAWRLQIPAAVLLAAGLVGCLPGCGSSNEAKRERIREVEPTAFRVADGEAGAVQPLAEAPPRTAVETDGSSGERRDAGAFRAVPGEPVSIADAGRPIEAPQLLDAKVGDINGRPVFVSGFLSPIEGRLRAEAQRLDREPWMREAAGIIQQEMRALITDELLKAEALSRLSVDQKAGLRRFLDDVRQNLLSQNRGSQQLAEERLRREQGLSQEEFLRQRQDRTLVRFTLQEEIQDRITVSWRDILQRYARDDTKYNPDPVAKYFIVRVDAPEEMSDDEAQGGEQTEATPSAFDEVTRRIAAGEPFADLAASDLNTWTITEGGVLETAFSGSLSEAEPFEVDELNGPASALSVGETTAPIPFGSSIIWIHLDAIEENSTSLYDAQLAISQQIRNERTSVELERYIDRLLGRASVSDVEDMMVRLLDIAAERYGPTRGTGRPTGTSRPSGAGR